MILAFACVSHNCVLREINLFFVPIYFEAPQAPAPKHMLNVPLPSNFIFCHVFLSLVSDSCLCISSFVFSSSALNVVGNHAKGFQ